MSLDIDQIALHQLIKRDEQNLELVLRESLLEPNWPRRCACSVRGKKSFWRLAARRPVACAMSWRNTRSPKEALSSSASIVTLRSSICWWRYSIT